MNEKNSNNLDTTIHHVCHPCGLTANYLTCLKKFGNPPLQACYSVSTYGEGVCDYCKMPTQTTETRDFFYPDFSLIDKVKKLLD